MVKLLCIETSGPFCSICLVGDQGEIIAEKIATERNGHSALIHVYINELLAENQVKTDELSAVAYSSGPGSYTGLRIGLSTAKGLALAIDKSLIEVSTTQSIAYAMTKKMRKAAGIYISMIDAGRMEVYFQSFDNELNSVGELDSADLDPSFFKKWEADKPIFIGGNGATKAQPIIGKLEQNVSLVTGCEVRASHMASIALNLYRTGTYANLAYVVPSYLKVYKPKKTKERF